MLLACVEVAANSKSKIVLVIDIIVDLLIDFNVFVYTWRRPIFTVVAILMFVSFVRLMARFYFFPMDLEFVDIVDQHYHGEPVTVFQQWVVGEFRARHGVLLLNRANEIVCRRVIHGIITTARADVRGVDLEMLTSRCVALAFIPSQRDLDLAILLLGQGGFLGWVRDALLGRGEVRDRIVGLMRPLP